MWEDFPTGVTDRCQTMETGGKWFQRRQRATVYERLPEHLGTRHLRIKPPPLNKNPDRFLKKSKLERIKTHGHFGKIEKNKNPRAKRAKFLGINKSPRAKRAEIFEKMELLVGISL